MSKVNGIMSVEVIEAEEPVGKLTMGVEDDSILVKKCGIWNDMVCCSAIQNPRLGKNWTNWSIRKWKQSCGICKSIVIVIIVIFRHHG